ncbi:hypothetical protein TRFO_02312 [Tritrichomonas foetus]|uniref:Ras-GAP domain-containing protein n=1 Tax=Tritrichomonas foetus TaxID=1144522 RepID=A0A1J4J528_9EUKA|nr:hypothetical protein TRFO_02312 [Tritrichomonas foetus]|eukprot:OHS93801.1 hypothetical protein TRFO_02312 [Tritrichomonas foetus]
MKPIYNYGLIYDFREAELPKTPDGSPLATFLFSRYSRADQVDELFRCFIREDGQFPEVDIPDINQILMQTLPPNFFIHLTMENIQDSNLSLESIFTPCQKYILKNIQNVLSQMKEKPYYKKILLYFAKRLKLPISLDASQFRFVGEMAMSKGKKVGILKADKTVDIYSKALLEPMQTITLAKLPSQAKEWEITKVETDNEIFSPLVAVFRSFSALNKCETLPIAAYSGFIDYITAPDMTVVSQLVKQDLPGIEFPLLTIFMFKNCHRRLLKYCVYEDVFSTEDPAQLMRKNSMYCRIVIDFLANQVQSLIIPYFNPIKRNICNSDSFDINSPSVETIHKVTDIFVKGIIEILPMIPSTIRFVCSCIYDACEACYAGTGHRGVFMAFFFRVIFPIFCQPQPTDPPGIKVDIKQMAFFGKAMTYIFNLTNSRSLSRLQSIAEKQTSNIEMIFLALVTCNEAYDALTSPTMTKACQMVDEIRKNCQKRIADLSFATTAPTQVLVHWLDMIARKI